MKLFKWTKRNEAFIPEVDAQHRTLFRLSDELHQAGVAGAGPGQVRSSMQALIASVEDHFSHEERLMRSTGYPTFAWHKQQHDGVRRRLKQFTSSLEQGNSDAPLLCAEYVAHWLNDHTMLTDRMMAAYLRNHERRQAVLS